MIRKLILLLALTSGFVKADLNDATKVFNGMVKTTKAQSYKSAKGYGLGFGSASIRVSQHTYGAYIRSFS